MEKSLAKLITSGGIYRNVSGESKHEVMSNLIGSLKPLAASKREALLQAVMEREALISTGAEGGIALPHPRTPMLEDGEEPFVAIAFPSVSPDWETPDGSKVHTIFLIVSKSSKQHLGVLTKINVLCQEKSFFDLISSRASEEKIIAAIEEAEKDWQ